MQKIITFNFAEPFIDRLAEYLDVNFIQPGKDLRRVAVVFGGKRPRLFLSRALAKRIGQGFFPPVMFTIDELVDRLAQDAARPGAGDLDQCYLIYQLALTVAPEILEKRKTFADFLPWAREILAFIEQLDLEDIDNRRLSAVEANARIGYDVPQGINQLLTYLSKLRLAYHEALRSSGMTARGFRYREAAQKVGSAALEEFDAILFCNFFYFHRTEEAIVKNLLDRGKAVLIFQGDERKWPVLERISRRLGCALREGDQPVPLHFQLQLYSVTSRHSQAAQAGEILKTIDRRDQTVIVLPDSDAVVPLLADLRPWVEDCNVSLGYPLNRSSLCVLLDDIFRCQLSRSDRITGERMGALSPACRQLGRPYDKQSFSNTADAIWSEGYYARDYLRVLRHPLVKNICWFKDPAVTRILVHKIEEILSGDTVTGLSGKLFLNLDEIEQDEDVLSISREAAGAVDPTVSREALGQALKRMHQIFFRAWEQIGDFCSFADALENLSRLVAEKSALVSFPFNVNIASRLLDMAQDMRESGFGKERFLPEDIFRIFTENISREMVSFSGSPLKGLQILGLLETRSLNFDQVIILDVNEGKLPRLQVHQPLIPREVMISLGLDRLELDEEIQRYQFMRLIGPARAVHLIYEENKEKERSRFVEELIWEQERKAGEIECVKARHASFAVKVTAGTRQIAKTPAMVDFLRDMPYSVSALNMYLDNPMDFYLNYVLGLRERDDLLDEPEGRDIGILLHAVLEETFGPLIGRQPEINAGFHKRLFSIFEQKFTARFGKNNLSDGFLMRPVLEHRLEQFYESEAGRVNGEVKEILGLEKHFEDRIVLPSGEMKFRYVVDRVDRLNDGSILVIDYKTGSTDKVPQGVQRIAGMEMTRENIRDRVKSFQLPLYTYCMKKIYPEARVQGGLYSLKTMKLERFKNGSTPEEQQAMQAACLAGLDSVWQEICNPDVPFVEDQR
ncbi:MAG: PD-(D/E)XK nuclease family protein [Candidatus Omnitrophica bacterium]|nr:PD-(D/E)XK nuclease family protein [Candidatus Omnitrophota bacterium]